MSTPNNRPKNSLFNDTLQLELNQFLIDHSDPLQILYAYYKNIQEYLDDDSDISISDLVKYLNIFQNKLDSKLQSLENYGSECPCHTTNYIHRIIYGDGEFSPDAYLEKTCLTCGGIKEST